MKKFLWRPVSKLYESCYFGTLFDHTSSLLLVHSVSENSNNPRHVALKNEICPVFTSLTKGGSSLVDYPRNTIYALVTSVGNVLSTIILELLNWFRILIILFNGHSAVKYLKYMFYLYCCLSMNELYVKNTQNIAFNILSFKISSQKTSRWFLLFNGNYIPIKKLIQNFVELC